MKIDMDCVCGDIAVLADDEKQKVLYDYNATQVPYPDTITMVEYFEKNLVYHPEHIAVECNEKKLTYSEFNARANYLGKILRERGVGRDSIVAIIAERSIDMMVAVFGILKAGGAYLPITTDMPLDRVKYILEDSRAKIALLGNGADLFRKELQGIDVLRLDENAGELSENLEIISKPRDLAYVIYTSGTTGNPKGVMIENRSLVNFVTWMIKDGFTDEDVILQKTTYSFDLSIWELFVWCVVGAKLVLLPSGEEQEPRKIADAIETYKITRTSFVPSVLQMFLPYIGTRQVESLKRIQLSGEALPVELANQFNQKSGGKTVLVNSYGPTEATVFATSKTVETGIYLEKMHVGKPMDNAYVYILNHNQLCGIGVIGEIYISGDGVARGYLNKPDLTAEKFMDDPFRQGYKMYRTGDLGRWLEDGSIEYLGRSDDQVKLRGYRIELGEIESKIKEYENVEAAAVLVKGERENKYLCAYVLSQKEFVTEELKEFLRKKLPGYMIPNYFVRLEQFPVTKNGKLNRRELPEPVIERTTAYVAPRNELEEKVKKMFETVLEVENIGTHDNFFELGGHSLKATKLSNLLERELGIVLPIRSIIEKKTISNICFSIQNESFDTDVKKKIEKHNLKQYAMSATQKRLYIIEQMGTSGTTYNIPLVFHINGKLDEKRFKQAFTELCKRHDSLRTHFLTKGEEFLQIVDDAADIELECFEGEYDKIDEFCYAFIRPFDLSKAPLMRVGLNKRNEKETDLILDLHHIIYDEGCEKTLFSELTKLYRGEELEEKEIQYIDYCIWADERNIEKQEQYWLDEFSGSSEVLDLRTDFSRPQNQSHNGKSMKTVIGRELNDTIKKFCIQNDVTEYMVFLSSLMVMIGKYSRQDEIIIGSPIAGRINKETQDIFGMFVNTLALKGNIDFNQNYNEFLKQIKAKCLRAYENQEYPFDELVNKVKVHRDSSRNPLFDIMFVMQNNDVEPLQLENCEVRKIEYFNEVSTFDITISIKEEEDGYAIQWEYCTDLFKEETIARMGAHYVEQLRNLLVTPDRKMTEVSMMGAGEFELVFHQFNETANAYASDKTVIELFEEQAEKHPDRIAVSLGEEVLTYQQLNERANYLGDLLRTKGAGADDIIGLMVPRSLDMLVGILGILKAGSAYLPMAMDTPMERLKYMIENSGTTILLADEGCQERMKELDNVDKIDLQKCKGYKKENLPVMARPDNLIYVIYTSGTTGKPKGVMVENRNVVNLSSWQIEYGNYNANTVLVQRTTYIFDGHAWEIFPILLAGAHLELICDKQDKDLGKLIELIPGKQVAMVPSMFRLLLHYAKINHKEDKIHFDKIYLAAEVLTQDLVDLYEEVHGELSDEMFNLYGPTECTVTATAYPVTKETKMDNIPIGKPVFNTQIFIMNDGELCGVGIPGEICIGGDGVTRGYLNNEELTSKQFIINKYTGQRCYRTGDIGYWLEDGNVQYIGRKDEQVKLRGYRIETSEIEQCIREVDGVNDAIVMVREDEKDKYLGAYIVGSSPVQIENLKEYLRERLPNYMIPNFILQLEKFPLTATGKLDKKSLPIPVICETDEYIEPENETEWIVAKAFETVLGIKNAGRNADFFNLGGHSLRAMKFATIMEEKLHKEIALREILQDRTVKNIAKRLRTNRSKIQYEVIEKQPEDDVFDMSSAEKRLFIIDQTQGENVTYNTPIVLDIHGEIDRKRMEVSFQALVNRHEPLHTYFTYEDGTYIQCIDKICKVKMEYEKITPDRVEKTIHEFIRPFNITKAPLIRCKLVEVEAESPVYKLLFDVHHIVCDGASIQILMQDFADLYNGKSLEPLTIQFKDYSVWEKSRDYKAQELYWLNEFKEEVSVLNLLTDYVRPKERSFQGSNLYVKIPSEKIKQLSRKMGVTEYAVMLSAYMILLSKNARQETINVGTPISGRTHKDTQNMCGMFVNTLVMKGNVKKDMSYEAFLTELKETCFQAYENQEYPFELLVDKLIIHSDSTRNPLFDVVFSLQNNDTASIQFDGNPCSFQDIQAHVAKFDLLLDVSEENGYYKCNWEYCTDLFSRETIRNFAKQYELILKEIVLEPAKKLSDFYIIDEEEREKILTTFNQTKMELPVQGTIIELFEEQVERTPDSIAVELGESSMTYRELNERANAVGRILKEYGFGPDKLAAVIVERSIEMMIAIYGVFKAGGAYVPMSMDYPAERIKEMMKECDTELILTNTNSSERIQFGDEYKMILVDEIRTSEKENLPHCAKPENLAYVIFTSGSTGRPKGVMVENHNLVNFATWYKNYCDVDENSVVWQLATNIFDASVYEIFGCASAGAKLLLIEEHQNSDPKQLLEIYHTKKVTHSVMVPSVLRMLLDYMEQHNLRDYLNSAVHFHVAAEVCTKDLVEQYARVTGKATETLYNMYGPTECTIISTHFKISNIDRYASVPIGMPVGNFKLYVLDNDKLCGIGVPGELCIGGEGVTRGYLNQEELTKEKYIENPYVKGERIYRSGDLVRWLNDGNIEYLGRIDEQVKIRGLRVELGEIETRMRMINQIGDAVAVIKGKNEDKFICVYYTGEEMDSADIKSHLALTLPDYMIPVEIVYMEKFPITQSGKINKKQLQAMESTFVKEIIEPRNENEKQVVEAFQQVLSIAQISIDDNFIEIGGHSLKAIKVVDFIEGKTGIRLSIVDILKEKTARRIATLLEGKTGYSNAFQIPVVAEEED